MEIAPVLPNGGQEFLQHSANYLEFFMVLITLDLFRDFCGILVGGQKTETRARSRTHARTHTHIYTVLVFAIKLFCNTLYIIRTIVLPERIPKTLL
jgi:hypothetical protein